MGIVQYWEAARKVEEQLQDAMRQQILWKKSQLCSGYIRTIRTEGWLTSKLSQS